MTSKKPLSEKKDIFGNIFYYKDVAEAVEELISVLHPVEHQDVIRQIEKIFGNFNQSQRMSSSKTTDEIDRKVASGSDTQSPQTKHTPTARSRKDAMDPSVQAYTDKTEDTQNQICANCGYKRVQHYLTGIWEGSNFNMCVGLVVYITSIIGILIQNSWYLFISGIFGGLFLFFGKELYEIERRLILK